MCPFYYAFFGCLAFVRILYVLYNTQQPVHHRCPVSSRPLLSVAEIEYKTVQKMVRVRDSRFVHVGSADTYTLCGHILYICTYTILL